MRAYHDLEWGVPLHNDQSLFEFLVLEGAQAGLSWSIILNRREAYRLAFDQFDIQVVAGYGEDKIQALLTDASIIRNQAKIRSAVSNAKAVMRIQEEYGSLDSFLWQFCGWKPICLLEPKMLSVSVESRAMSSELVKRGLRFVGPTICHAFMQAVGMINDHESTCYRRAQLAG